MKHTLISILLLPITLIGQVPVDDDSLIYHFDIIINQYRIDNDLSPIEINSNLKDFTEEWSHYLSVINQVTHGSEDISFTKRVDNYDIIPPKSVCVENCGDAFTPSTPMGEEENVVCSRETLIPYLNKMMKWKCTQKEYAEYIFLLWKSSPPHDRAMLDPRIHTYFISSSANSEKTYFSFIGME